MSIDNALLIIGPFVLAVNLGTMFFYMRPKRGVPFTLAMLLAYSVLMHFFMIITKILDTELELYIPILFLPVVLWLFQGQSLQKIFYCFMQHQITALETFVADMLVGITIGHEHPYALVMFLSLSIALLGVHVILVLRFGRRVFKRMFVDSRRIDWALYSFGAIFSFILIVSVKWVKVGAEMYIALMLFILWSFGLLCFTIIKTHEKTVQTHYAQTLLVQMNAMREQTDVEIKYRNDMEILRHDMRHEMGVIMELFRTGKIAEAETVYTEWKNSLAGTAPAALCAEPMLNAVFSRFERRAEAKHIRLYVKSNIPAALPIDTIKLSVIISNALENALVATEKIVDHNKRTIRVKLLQSDTQIGLEIVNPCMDSVEFDDKGLPVTLHAGHGLGVRSIAAYAADNGYLLDFSCQEAKFTMRLVMESSGCPR